MTEATTTLTRADVVTDITGETGMKIVRAIVNGERDPKVLATFRDPRCKASVETIRASLVGNYQPEHVFALTQALALYDFYQARNHRIFAGGYLPGITWWPPPAS